MKQTKKKNSILTGTWFYVSLVVITSLLVITVAMNLILPEEPKPEEPTAWAERTVPSSKIYDDGLTSVYTQETIPVSNPATPAPTPAETPAPSPSAPSTAKFLLPVNGTLTKDFSDQELVFSETMQDWRVHEGIDLAVAEGTEVLAAADGVVELAGEDGMMGICVLLTHTDDTQTYYANLKDEALPDVGSEIHAGEVIGKVGNTAALEVAEQPHLHFEIRKGETRLNPHDRFTDFVSDDE